jgi:hypothetical protein
MTSEQIQTNKSNNQEVWDKMQSQINQLKTAHDTMREEQQALNANVTKSRQATKKSIDQLEESQVAAIADMHNRQATSEANLKADMAEARKEAYAIGKNTTKELQEFLMALRRDDQAKEDKKEAIREYKEQNVAEKARAAEMKAEAHRTHTELMLGSYVRTPGVDVYNSSRTSTTASREQARAAEATPRSGAKNRAVAAPNSAERVSIMNGRKKSRGAPTEFFTEDNWGNNQDRMDHPMEEINKENDRAPYRPVVSES